MRLYVTLFLTLGLLGITPSVLAAEVASEQAQLVEKSTPSTYTLPYPGMLPDNPLYSLKMFRDRIVYFLISDPVKRAEFNLLQADKRLQAGVMLWQEKPEKAELTISTISKGENYFGQALSDTRQAIKEGRETGSIKGDLVQASRKHNEVILSLKKEMPVDFQDELENLVQRTNNFHQQASTFK